MASQHVLTHSPAGGDHIWGVCEVGQWVEGQFIEVNGRDMSEGLGGPLVEFGYEPLCTFDILRWPPFVLLNSVSLPTYEIFKFPSGYLTIQDAIYFVLFNFITDYEWWWVELHSFGDGICC